MIRSNEEAGIQEFEDGNMDLVDLMRSIGPRAAKCNAVVRRHWDAVNEVNQETALRLREVLES